jgi:DNA-binding beta-propeller fold protein YncE
VNVAILDRDLSTGRLTRREVLPVVGEPEGTTNRPFGTSIVIDRLGEHVYFSWETGDRIAGGVPFLSRSPTTGLLVEDGGISQSELSSIEPRPAAVAVSPGGSQVFLVSRNGFLVSSFGGNLEIQRELGRVNGLTGAADVAVSPDGSNVYVAAGAFYATAGAIGAVSVFRVNLPDQ